jgi:uncharacterized protein (TIGR02246 family)
MKHRSFAIEAIAAVAMLASSAACADRPTVEALNAQWDKTFNSGDAAALAALYHPNATVSPGNGKVVAGRAEIEKLFKGFFEAGAHNHKIDVVATSGTGTMLQQVANWKANGAAKDGKKPDWKGVLSSTFERGADGKWLAVSHVWNAASE